ncbi:MAG: iron-containing alcohol dehydrogenase [Chloroflexi bacterium]|uniref:Iron-containing alcohol dehydrogenase n=1 Tax=Candidatus Chlorohelix allophototropha TaxID=3003348 RepID=A0A8T7LYC2_9CHLR|nr:iron-containing alcohol dehydrogenase [Chloroflexota bacterium]WJW66311.1 iron-containing alcohol dehydrogenase [Chloroflexota bacterium L227-S17]
MSELKGDFYYLPMEHVIFGAGSAHRLSEEVIRLGGKRVLIVTGQTLATQTDVVKKIEAYLGEYHIATFSGIRQHTPKSDLERALEIARQHKIDALVSVGGGSPIDGTKAIALELFKEHGKMPPHVAIPTTLSAAEFTHIVGVTDEALKMKTGFVNPRAVPHTVILDPELTLSTPLVLWLSTGIRALDHAVETLYAPGAHPINDVLALEAIHKLFAYLPKCKANPEDTAVRGELQVAAWMSFFSSMSAAMGLSHNLGRRIGASFDVPHGITSCITLAPVMYLMVEKHAAALAKIARVLELDRAGITEEVGLAKAAAAAVYKLVQDLGLPQHLKDVGLTEINLAEIASTSGPFPLLPPDQLEKVLKILW